MRITLYSTGCPKCRVLAAKLNQAGIPYQIVDDVEKMESIGIESLPVLEVSGIKLDFYKALQWVKAQTDDGKKKE